MLNCIFCILQYTKNTENDTKALDWIALLGLWAGNTSSTTTPYEKKNKLKEI
jgi:hypothetical protein